MYKPVNVLLSVLAVTVLLSCSPTETTPVVELMRVPNQGIQPRIVFDEWGDTHLLYFRVDPAADSTYQGHLYYSRYDNDSGDWMPELQVSNQTYNHGDAIYRANLAVDGDGGVHVTWFMDRPARFMYARSSADMSSFIEPRLIAEHHLDSVDAGADIAAYRNRVSLVWGAGDLMREDQRSVYMLESLDHGTSFGEETMIGDPALGACACCALAAEFNQSGELMVAYRSAINNTGRHMQRLIVARNAHNEMQISYQPQSALTEWELSSCPVSTNDIVRDESAAGEYWLAYENQGQVATLNLSSGSMPTLVSVNTSGARQKHPAMVFNSAGYQLLAWGEGGGFFDGGMLHLALLDANGAAITLPPIEETEIPDRSFVAVMVKPDGNFLVLY